MIDRKNNRVRKLLNDELSQSTGTQELIQQFKNTHLNDLQQEENQNQWGSTTNILSASIPIIEPDHDVSESTKIIQNDSLISPSKRPVSGSSMGVLSSLDEIQKTNEQEIDFNLFYQLLDDKLPNDLTSFHFKSIVSNYCDIIESHGGSASADKFLITIYNQLRKTNSITPKLQKIIDTFLDSPANLGMKLANYQHYNEQRDKARFFKLWLIKRRKFYQIEKSMKIWSFYLKKKFLCKIILAYEIVTEDYEQHADACRETQLVMKSWNLWRTKFVSLMGINDIADVTQKKKFLQLWQNKIIGDYEEASLFYKRNLITGVFKRWKLKKKYNQINSVLKCYNQWKSSFFHIHTLEEEAKQLEMVLHAGFFFYKWKKQLSTNFNRLSDLNDLCDGFIIKKFMKNWKNAFVLKEAENNVSDKRNELMLRFSLEQWKRKLTHQTQLVKFDEMKDHWLIRTLINRWKSTLTLLNKSDTLEAKSLTKKFLKHWRLSTLLSQYQSLKEHDSISRIFQHWLKDIRLKHSSVKFQEQNVVAKYWEFWLLKHVEQQNALELSQEVLETYTKLIYYNNWKKFMKIHHENEEIANTHFKKKFIGVIISKYNKLKKLDIIANKYHKVDTINVTLKRFFNHWVEKYTKQVNDKLKTILEGYKATKDLNDKAIVFRRWLDRYKSYINQEEIYKQDFVYGKLKKKYFDKWIDKYEEIKELEAQANEVNYLNLLSSGFIKFQLKLQQIEILEERIIVFEEDKSAELILKYLKKWTYKNLQIEKDNEILKFFNKRWERAHLRALLSLWKNKTTEKLQEGNSDKSVKSLSPLKSLTKVSQPSIFDKFEEKISEFDEEDDSPTKSKSKLHKSSLSKLTQTPKKSIIDPSGVFQSISSIPGSERVKKKRLDALRNHYNQIKYAIPSPIDFKKVGINLPRKTDPDRIVYGLNLPPKSIFNSATKYQDQEDQNNDEPLDNPVMKRIYKEHGSASKDLSFR